MTIELPEELEVSLVSKTQAHGLPPDVYVRQILEREIQSDANPVPQLPLKSGLGMWAKYGVNISDGDIAENRADMFRNFGEDF
jgi:hypothetical protein